KERRPDNGIRPVRWIVTDDKKSLVSQYAAAGDAVIGIAVLSGLGAWGGFWLDDKIHTTPWCAIGFAMAGMMLGLTRMVLRALKQDRESTLPASVKPLPPDTSDEQNS